MKKWKKVVIAIVGCSLITAGSAALTNYLLNKEIKEERKDMDESIMYDAVPDIDMRKIVLAKHEAEKIKFE